MRGFFWPGLLVAGLLGGCGTPVDPSAEQSSPARPKTLLVCAAASTREPVEELIATFEQSHPEADVRASFAASSTLANQIAAGSEAELFISADEAWAEFLVERKHTVESRPLVANRLVLIVPADAQVVPVAPEDLRDGSIGRIAVGDPRAVPVGRYAKQALVKLGLWDSLEAKIVGAADTRQALAYVETASAEAGIVYATDVLVSKRVRVAFMFDHDLNQPIVYPLVLLEAGRHEPAARALFEFLQSDEAAEVFERYGFERSAERRAGSGERGARNAERGAAEASRASGSAIAACWAIVSSMPPLCARVATAGSGFLCSGVGVPSSSLRPAPRSELRAPRWNPPLTDL